MKRVLVALDRTEAAEAVLPAVKALAGAGTTVRLVHVAPLPDNIVGTDGHLIAYSDQETARMEAEWLDYCSAIEARDQLGAETAIRFGDPAEGILAEALDFGADTIVVTTGTRLAIRRVLFGSVAEALVKRASAAVMVYRPQDTEYAP
jgi:nucleotide-binding universal stress UspA family protein